MKRTLIYFTLSVILGFGAGMGAVGCIHNAPASLSTQGQSAFYRTRLVKALDVIRDTAVDAEAAGALSTATTRKVVVAHESLLKVIDVAAAGWKAAVGTGMDELTRDLPPSEAQLLRPYVALIKIVLQEVQ